jgi:O-antigen/teichoic acid export membrane protein
MSNSDRQLLNFGVFLIIIVAGILLVIAGIIGWGLFVPVVAVLCGLWAIALGVMWTSKTQKYQRGFFSTIASGAGLIALGAAWYLFGINWLYSLVVILLAVAALAVATSLRRK